MSDSKTTWEDLANMGWPIHQVFGKANDQRGGSMRGDDDLYLNTGAAAKYQWWSYNTLVGDPYIAGQRPQTNVSQETAWSYDNSKNDQSFKDVWTETWKDTTRATLTVSSSFSFTLSNHITIFDVAESGIDISISTSSSSTQTKEESHEESHTWSFDVGPHEKLSLIRVKTVQTDVVNYVQEVGLTSESMIATDGNKWEGHYYYGMNLNYLLNTPRGKVDLQGSSEKVMFTFKIVREGPKGSTSTPAPIDFSAANTKFSAGVLRKRVAEMEKATTDAAVAGQVQIMVPAVGEK